MIGIFLIVILGLVLIVVVRRAQEQGERLPKVETPKYKRQNLNETINKATPEQCNKDFRGSRFYGMSSICIRDMSVSSVRVDVSKMN